MKSKNTTTFFTPAMSHQEYHYTAYPEMALCQGSNCYCFQGYNQMNEPISDSESVECHVDWHILTDTEWGVELNNLKFLHPRVLLAYFRFISMHNELASQAECIHIPLIPKEIREYILNHISIKETPPEFKEEVDSLKMYVLMHSAE